MNMYSDKEQKTNQEIQPNSLKKWLRRALYSIGITIGVVFLFVIAFFVYIAFYPVNITSLVKYWLPLPVVTGTEKNKPAGRVTFDKLILDWPLYRNGLSAPITLHIDGMKLLDVNGDVQDYIHHGQITFAPYPLLYKQITPLSLNISGVYFQFKRNHNNQYLLNLSNQKLSDKHSSAFQIDLMQLKHIKIDHGDVQLKDAITNNVVELKKIDVNVHPFFIDQALVAIGHIKAELNTNGKTVHIIGYSEQEHNPDAIRQKINKIGKLVWHLNIDRVNPSDFAVILPKLAKLNDINIPVSLNTQIDLKLSKDKKSFIPSDADLIFQIGKGKVIVNQQAYYPSYAVGNAHVHLSSGLNGSALIDVNQFKLQLRSESALDNDQSGPSFDFKARLTLVTLFHTKNIHLDLSVFTPLLDFSTVQAYWPKTVAKGAYAWVGQNITQGQAHDFHLDAGLASATGWKHLDLVSLGGEIKSAENMEIYWLRPVPPLKDVNAQLTFVDLNHIVITHHGGYQVVYPHNTPTDKITKLAVPEGKVSISGLSNHQEYAVIEPKIQGKLQDLLALLSEPRLKILSRHPIPFTNPSGMVKDDLSVGLPLKKKITMDQIQIHAHNQVTHAYLGNVALDRDLKDADLSIDVDNKHLEVAGKGMFSVFPVSLHYAQQFYHKNDQSKTDTANVKLQITPNNLKQMGVDTAGDLTGAINLLVDYNKLYNGKASIRLKFDLLNAGITLPIWQKDIGQVGCVSGTILLNHNKLVNIQNLSAEGHNLSVKAYVNIQDNVPQLLNIKKFEIGRSVGSATLKFPMTKDAIDHPSQGDVNISVKADTLDISGFLKKYFDETKRKHIKNQQKEEGYKLPVAATGKYTGPKGRRWITNLQAHQIFYTQHKYLGNVTISTEYNGVRLMSLSFGMRYPTVVTASLFPKKQHRFFYLDAQDLGVLLESLGVFEQISGGHTILKGSFDDTKADAPFEGELGIGSFIITHPPKALLHLSNASIYGLFKKRPKNGIKIKALKSNINIQDGILTIEDGRLYNAEIGATLQGNVNLDHGVFDLTGTIVPVYAINKLFGYIPSVGKLFSPEKEGGFVAIPFDIKGPFKKPVMDVYIERILTPGILRQLF